MVGGGGAARPTWRWGKCGASRAPPPTYQKDWIGDDMRDGKISKNLLTIPKFMLKYSRYCNAIRKRSSRRRMEREGTVRALGGIGCGPLSCGLREQDGGSRYRADKMLSLQRNRVVPREIAPVREGQLYFLVESVKWKVESLDFDNFQLSIFNFQLQKIGGFQLCPTPSLTA